MVQLQMELLKSEQSSSLGITSNSIYYNISWNLTPNRDTYKIPQLDNQMKTVTINNDHLILNR